MGHIIFIIERHNAHCRTDLPLSIYTIYKYAVCLYRCLRYMLDTWCTINSKNKFQWNIEHNVAQEIEENEIFFYFGCPHDMDSFLCHLFHIFKIKILIILFKNRLYFKDIFSDAHNSSLVFLYFLLIILLLTSYGWILHLVFSIQLNIRLHIWTFIGFLSTPFLYFILISDSEENAIWILILSFLASSFTS